MEYPPDAIKHEVFKFDLDTASLRLALLKENFEYRAFYKKFIKSIEGGDFSFPAYRFEEFGLPGVRYTVAGPSHDETLKLLDPLNDNKLEEVREKYLLQKIFYSHAVMQLKVNHELPFEGMAERELHTLKKVKPYEKFYSVDLRKKKKQILREFEEFLNNSYRFRDYLSIETWAPDNSRLRKEAWNHLEVWKLRKKRTPFSKIAEILKLTEDNAKKSFYRAYELTQCRKYDPEILRKEIWLVKQEELKKTCATCPDRDTCRVLCPEVLAFVDQDVLRNSREKLR